MSQRVINASNKSGIGLTLQPVLYEQSGVKGGNLISGQDRFGLKLCEFNKLIEEWLSNNNLQMREIGMSIRIAITGVKNTPPINDIILALGIDECIRFTKKFSNPESYKFINASLDKIQLE